MDRCLVTTDQFRNSFERVFFSVVSESSSSSSRENEFEKLICPEDVSPDDDLLGESLSGVFTFVCSTFFPFRRSEDQRRQMQQNEPLVNGKQISERALVRTHSRSVNSNSLPFSRRLDEIAAETKKAMPKLRERSFTSVKL